MSEPVWIDHALVLALHDRRLVAHGGAAGLRDASWLRSALSRPLNHIACASSDVIELAAKFTTGIVQNHPYRNTRTGFVVGVLFLELNGYRFTASEEQRRKRFSTSPHARSTKRHSANFCEPTPSAVAEGVLRRSHP